MATEIFKRDLATLEKISEHLKNLGKTIKSGVDKPMRDFEKTTSRISKATDRITNSFDKLFGVVKRIGLASMLTGGALALRGAMAQKQSVESKVLGVSNKQKGALEYAGKQTMGDSDFFKDILSTIKKASVSQEGYDLFANIGLRAQDIRAMKPLEALKTTLDALSKYDKSGKEDLFEDLLGGLTGLSQFQFEAIDFKKFNESFKEGLGYYDESNEKLKGVGESLNRVTANFQLLIDKTLSSLAPSFEKVLNNISRGMNAIAQNPAFQDMLKKMEDWLLDMSKGFDSKISEMIKSIPDILRDMQIVFLNIVSSLANLSTWWQTGEDDEKARKFAESMKRKADLLERDRYKDRALESTTREEFVRNLGEAGMIEKKLGITGKESIAEKNAQEIWAKNQSFQPQITINIQNDPTQAQMQKNFTTSISMGGNNGGVR